MRDKQDNSGHSFASYFKRATSPLVVLRLLAERPMYGYELTRELERRSGGGFTISLLYPVIYRLEEQSYVQVVRTEVVDGRARSYYGITAQGRTYLKETLEDYKQISETFRKLMEGEEEDGKQGLFESGRKEP